MPSFMPRSSTTKYSIVHRSLKAKLFRYLYRHQAQRLIDVLDEVTQSYNGRYDRSIKMAPRAVTKKDEARPLKVF
jgi:hypothetical protein